MPIDFISNASNRRLLELCLIEWLKQSSMLVLGMMLVACSTQPPATTSTSPSHKSLVIRIGTYNVFTGTHDVPRTVKVIRQLNADVMALQELSPEGARLLDHALRRDYPYRHFSEGLAVLSRYPLRNPRYQHSQLGINGFLFAEVESPGGRFQVASLHLDPLRIWTTREKWTLPAQLMWGQGEIHRAEVEQITDALRPDLPTVLAGDFNSASHVAIKQLQKQGFTDSFSEVTPNPDHTHSLHFKLLDFPTGRRIDYILHDSSFKTIESRFFPGPPSDHDPLLSVLAWKN